MKQKITIKLQMCCDKCRNKALKIASDVEGVSSVSIEGNDKDGVVVVGEGVDTICLGKLLKKKFRCVIILTVEEVKPKPPEKKEEKKEKPQCCKCQSHKCHGQCSTTICYGPCPPWNPCSRCCITFPTSCDPCYYRVVYEPYQDSCSIQ